MIFRRLPAVASFAWALAGCSAVVATAVKLTAKTVGAVADAVIPGGEDDAAQRAPRN